MANFHALLIGIDFYQPNPYYKSLQGAVGDIDKVASYLEKSLQVETKNITRLTSPLPDTNSLADVRSARAEIPPTYENIVKAFKTITETANPQDLVYIHYSGHGGRVKTIFPELKGEGQYDEGIVPMDVGDDGYYLRDVEIATLLKRMTDKGLIVTVIFDSCHSGGATRNDNQIRGNEDRIIDGETRPQDSLVAEREILVQNWLNITENNSQESWLPNQGDYIFLGACRPSEYAYESIFEGKQRNGALTYWMIDTLANSKSTLTYQSLYNRVKGMIQSKFSNQVPMLMGDSTRLVFGDQREYKPYTVTVIEVAENGAEITLDAGLAAGLSSGTRFAIYPFEFTNLADKSQQIAIAEITDEIEADKSKARIIEQDSLSPLDPLAPVTPNTGGSLGNLQPNSPQNCYGVHTSADRPQNPESSPPFPPSLEGTRFQSPPELSERDGEVSRGLQGADTGSAHSPSSPYPIEAWGDLGGKNLRDQTQKTYMYTVAQNSGARGAEIKGKIEPGAAAVMVTAPIDLIRKVRLFNGKQAGEREQDLPPELVDKQTAALEKIRQALAGNGWIVEVKQGEEAHYQVAVARDGSYEICIGMPIKNLRPALSIEDPEAPQKVVERLIHLTKYQSVQQLNNPVSDLTDYLVFELCDRHKQPFPDPQNVSLKPGEISFLKIKNNYSQILNVAVLDLDPTWAISQVPIQGNEAAFFPLDYGQEVYTKLRLALPPNYRQTTETLKIFATKGLANFQWLILPSLDEQPVSKGNNLNEYIENARGIINPLNNLLTMIGSDINNPPEKTRAMVYESDPEAEWVTKEIQITVIG